MHAALVQCASLVECTLVIDVLRPAAQSLAHGPEIVTIPFLRELKVMVKDSYPSTLYAEFLDPLVLPSLEKLSLEPWKELGEWGSSSALIALLDRSCCPLTHLRLHNFGQTDLEPVLELTPLLTHLSANDVSLTASLQQQIGRCVLVPHLQTLECRIDSSVGEDFVRMIYARWVTTARRASSSLQGDLRSLCLHTPHPTQHTEVGFLSQLKDIARSLGLMDRSITLNLDR